MPEVIADYQQDRRLLNAQATQLSILETYCNDFGKYTTKAKHKYLQQWSSGQDYYYDIGLTS